MSTDEFQEIWKEYDRRLERQMSLSRRLFGDLQRQKVGAELRPVLRSRFVGIVLGIFWLWLMAFCMIRVWSQPVMAISFGVFCVCTALGIIGYIRDVAVIRAIGYSDNVIGTQRKLVGMQSTMLRDIRLAWLQLPFWASFFVSNGMIRAGGRPLYFVEVPIFVLLAGLAIFGFFNLTMENVRRKKWVAAMVRGAGSKRVARAVELLKELEEFEKEERG